MMNLTSVIEERVQLHILLFQILEEAKFLIVFIMIIRKYVILKY